MSGSGSGGRTIKQATGARSGRQQRRVPAVIDELSALWTFQMSRGGFGRGWTFTWLALDLGTLHDTRMVF
jgi:hypothetical protein